MQSAAHTNNEGEHIEIAKSSSGRFKGKLILILHDDPPSTTKAYHLLDSGTAYWLLLHLSILFPEEYEEFLLSETLDRGELDDRGVNDLESLSELLDSDFGG